MTPRTKPSILEAEPENVGCWGCAGTKERPECDGRCQRSVPYDFAAMLADQEGT